MRIAVRQVNEHGRTGLVLFQAASRGFVHGSADSYPLRQEMPRVMKIRLWQSDWRYLIAPPKVVIRDASGSVVDADRSVFGPGFAFSPGAR